MSQPKPLPSPDKATLKRRIADLEEENGKKDDEIQRWKENSAVQEENVKKATAATERLIPAANSTEDRCTKLSKENAGLQQRITGLVNENTALKADKARVTKERDDALAKLARQTGKTAGAAAGAAAGVEGEGNKVDDPVSWLFLFSFATLINHLYVCACSLTQRYLTRYVCVSPLHAHVLSTQTKWKEYTIRSLGRKRIDYLRAALKSEGADTSGSKPALVARLQWRALADNGELQGQNEKDTRAFCISEGVNIKMGKKKKKFKKTTDLLAALEEIRKTEKAKRSRKRGGGGKKDDTASDDTASDDAASNAVLGDDEEEEESDEEDIERDDKVYGDVLQLAKDVMVDDDDATAADGDAKVCFVAPSVE